MPVTLNYASRMRALAIACVVLIHVAYNYSSTSISGLAAVVDIASRWCVPVFFMLSGALLLDPARSDSPHEFFLKRFKRIGVPLLFWSCLYFFIRSSILHQQISPRDILNDLLSGSPSIHLWFLYALLGIYLFTPLIRVYFNRQSRKEQWLMTIFFLTFSGLSALIWTYYGQIGWRIPPKPIITVEWMFYVGYFLLGYLIRDIKISRQALILLIIGFLLMVAINSFAYFLLARLGYDVRAHGLAMCFASPAVMLLSICAYLVISNASSKPPMLLTIHVSEASFGIYLIHIAILDLLWHVFKWPSVFTPSPLALAQLGCLVFLISLVLVIFGKKLSIIARVFG